MSSTTAHLCLVLSRFTRFDLTPYRGFYISIPQCLISLLTNNAVVRWKGLAARAQQRGLSDTESVSPPVDRRELVVSRYLLLCVLLSGRLHKSTVTSFVFKAVIEPRNYCYHIVTIVKFPQGIDGILCCFLKWDVSCVRPVCKSTFL